MVSLFTHSHQKSRIPSPRHSSSSLVPEPLRSPDIDLALGLSTAALSVHQLTKARHSPHHRKLHFLTAGVASAISAGAFALMAKGDKEDEADFQKRLHQEGHEGGMETHKLRHLHHHARDHSRPPPLHRLRLHSASSPDLPRFGRCECEGEGEDGYAYAVEGDRGYYSDDESETHHLHGRHPRLPYHDHDDRDEDHDVEEEARRRGSSPGLRPKRREGSESRSRRRHSFAEEAGAVFEESDEKEERGDRHARRRRGSGYHRSPSPSPPRHRGQSVG